MKKITYKNLESLENKLIDLLPHGSGINFDWEITFLKNGNIICKNYFHATNEWGYYSGIMPFTFKIFRHKKDVIHILSDGREQKFNSKNDLDFKITCNENRRVNFYGLKDYLWDTFDHYFFNEPDIKGLIEDHII